jgi:hypothetical protein
MQLKHRTNLMDLLAECLTVALPVSTAIAAVFFLVAWTAGLLD